MSYFVKESSNSTLCTTCSESKRPPLLGRHVSNYGDRLPNFETVYQPPVQTLSYPSPPEKGISIQFRNLCYHLPSFSA